MDIVTGDIVHFMGDGGKVTDTSGDRAVGDTLICYVEFDDGFKSWMFATDLELDLF